MYYISVSDTSAMTEKPKSKRGSKPGVKRGPYKPSVVDMAKAEPVPIKVAEVPDLFAPTPATASEATGGRGRVPEKPKEKPIVITGGVDKFGHDIHLLKLEWAIKYPLLKPTIFLKEIKGYSQAQTDKIMEFVGGEPEWQAERGKILDKLTESVVKRHLDQLAEVNETHVRASKIGMAKAIEFLSRLTLDPAKGPDGKLITDAKGKPVWKGFRSIDMVNIANAMHTFQTMYRQAMGLPNSEGGLAQILEKVTQLNVQNNFYGPGEAPKPKTEVEKKMEEELSYDDIVELIEYRREQKRIREMQEKEAAEKAKAVATQSNSR